MEDRSTLQEYILDIEKDTKLTSYNIMDLQLKLPAIKHKYVSRLINHKRILGELRLKRTAVAATVAKEIKDKAVYKVTEAMASKAASDHNSIKEVDDKIRETELIIQLLEKTERVLSSMTYDVKNVIELMKLEVT